MKKLTILIVSLFTFLNLYSQQNKVSFDIFNSTEDTLYVYVTVSSSGSFNDNGDNVFTPEILPPKKAIKKSNIKLPRYSILKAWGEIKSKGGKTEVEQALIQKNTSSFKKTLKISLNSSNRRDVVELTTIANKYKYDPSLFYNKNELSPKPINGLFNQYLGAIIAYREIGDSIKIERRIFPTTLGTVDRIHFGTKTSTDEYVVSGVTNQGAEGKIPIFAELGVNLESTNTYEIKLSYKGIGVIDWENHNNVDIDKAFFKLSDTTLYVIGEMRERYPDLKLDIIDQAFVFDGIFSEVTKLNKLSITNSVNASTFFNNEGYYNKETKSLNSEVFGSSYIGYWSSRTVDLTGALDKATYVYVTKELFQVKQEEDVTVVQHYDSLRITNPTLPKYNSKEEIIRYYESKKAEIKEKYEIPESLDKRFENQIIQNDQDVIKGILDSGNSGFEFDKDYKKIFEEILKKQDQNIKVTP
ncbi:MAG: hypothetical protein KI786_13955, partial [Mameliella sp.]|nr:hypothetical protein [Phaeodactylibacter sp.]